MLDHIIPDCCKMQIPSLFREGERAIQKIRDIVKYLEDVIFPKMHVLLELDF